jgi:hypothetical protein
MRECPRVEHHACDAHEGNKLSVVGTMKYHRAARNNNITHEGNMEQLSFLVNAQSNSGNREYYHNLDQ